VWIGFGPAALGIGTDTVSKWCTGTADSIRFRSAHAFDCDWRKTIAARDDGYFLYELQTRYSRPLPFSLKPRLRRRRVPPGRGPAGRKSGPAHQDGGRAEQKNRFRTRPGSPVCAWRAWKVRNIPGVPAGERQPDPISRSVGARLHLA